MNDARTLPVLVPAPTGHAEALIAAGSLADAVVQALRTEIVHG